MTDLRSPDVRWVGGQLALLTVGSVGGLIEGVLLGRGFSLWSGQGALVCGAVCAGLAGVVLIQAKRDLGENLTMNPTPVERGRLVESGVYGVVRHPMYLGVLLAMSGLAIVLGSWLAFLIVIALVPFFYAKSGYEEQLLVERYPDYAHYRRTVRHRFIPWLL